MSADSVLRVWGGDSHLAFRGVGRLPDAAESEHVSVWWMDQDAAEAAQKRIHEMRLNIVTDVSDDEPRLRTVAVVTLKYGDRLFVIEHDFGFGYGAASAEFMFREGNYSCDCNRKIFLRERYSELPDDEECGDEIEMIDLRIERRSA